MDHSREETWVPQFEDELLKNLFAHCNTPVMLCVARFQELMVWGKGHSDLLWVPLCLLCTKEILISDLSVGMLM